MVVPRRGWRRLAVLFGVAALVSGCSGESSTATADGSNGESSGYRLLLDDAELMHLVIEPAAEVLWDSAGQIITADGVEELAPTTDEAWFEVERNAATLAEAGNLLMLPDRARGREDWVAVSRGLIDTGEMAMRAAAEQDPDALFEAGAAIYGVCTACHQRYWSEGGRFISGEDEDGAEGAY